MTYRFVHAADIHLDSPLRSLALRDPALADLIGNATRQAFVRIIDLCLDEQVDALLLVGDLYDGDQTSMKTNTYGLPIPRETFMEWKNFTTCSWQSNTLRHMT